MTQVKPDLDELNNVQITTVADGQLVAWNSFSSKWVNTSTIALAPANDTAAVFTVTSTYDPALQSGGSADVPKQIQNSATLTVSGSTNIASTFTYEAAARDILTVPNTVSANWSRLSLYGRSILSDYAGSGTLLALTGLYLQTTARRGTVTNLYAIEARPYVTPDASQTVTVTQAYSMNLVGGVFSTNANATANVTNVYGALLQPMAAKFGSGGSVSVTTLYGVYILPYIYTATVGTVNAIYIAPSVTASTVTTFYGLRIENLTAGGTNYAIYTNAGAIRFGDLISQNVNVGATNTIANVVTLAHSCTGTPTTGFGSGLLMQLESSTTSDQDAALLTAEWADATHASRKAKAVLSVYDTAQRKGLTVEADGAAADVYFEGGAGSGLPYGSCYGNEIGWTQAAAVQDTWYIISDADMSDGSGGLNLIAHDGSGKLTATKAGRYHITYSICLECSALNKHVQTGISVNGSVINDGISHYEVASPNAQLHVGGTAVISLAASGYVEVAIRTTDTGTPDLAVDHLNFSVVQVGG